MLSLSILANAQSANDVPAKLLGKFKVGVNVTRWFCYLQDPKDIKHFESYWLKDDFDHLKRLGVKFVRLCVSPDVIYDSGKLNSLTLPYLDRAIDKLTGAGQAVLIDLHDNGQLKLDQP